MDHADVFRSAMPAAMLPSSKCSLFTADQIEQYVHGVLPEDAVNSFEEHLLVCPHCQDAVQQETEFRELLRPSLGDLDKTDSIQ